ncbi:MAG TPA: metal-dependent hydrolase [Cyclobacteriaceae bacterium]|nr:metal-dependent hydrolase [Cyclobacteriaceae bacterium]
MDSLTHIVLGACVGEAAYSKKLGKKALLLGAFAQSFPDVDSLASLFITPAENLLFHRSVTHSFLFVASAAPALAWLVCRIFPSLQLPRLKLTLFFALQMALHILLDTCNAYGTKLFWPFNMERFSFDLLFVADPFFSLPLLASALVFLVLKQRHPLRKKWLMAAMLLPGLYLVYAVFNKFSISRQVERTLQAQQIPHTAFITKPTAFNTWLWYIVVPSEDGYYIGYRSLFDDKDYPTPFEYFPKNEQLLPLPRPAEVAKLQEFSDGCYTVEQHGDSLFFNVLRFGRIAGWDRKDTDFTFHYYLNEGFDNTLVMQRGRVREWNLDTMVRMVRRIKGVRPE